MRASANHLAFSNDSDEEDDENDGDNDAKAEPWKQKGPGLMSAESIDVKEFPTAEELCENDEWSTPSFNL
jgi:hypothetical protein